MLISKQQRDKNKTCFVEGWDVITKQKCNIPQQYDWQFITILESSFLAISVFCLAIPITRHSEDVLVTKWSMTSSFTNWARFLKLLHLFNWNGQGPHHDIHIWFELYHGGCMQFVEVRGTKSEIWQMLVNKPTWQRNVYLWQRHWSSWCLSETWLGKITEVSQSRVIFWFNSLHSSGIHDKTFNLSSLDS
jgi:hypothetical protein